MGLRRPVKFGQRLIRDAPVKIAPQDFVHWIEFKPVRHLTRISFSTSKTPVFYTLLPLHKYLCDYRKLLLEALRTAF
jgi:hypothetical protein